MLALRLTPDLEKRLDTLARKTGRTKSFYARQAISEHLDDLEDIYLAERRFAKNNSRIALEDVESEFPQSAQS